MRCPLSMESVPHKAHWHAVTAGNVTVAGGQCLGVEEPKETVQEARAALAAQAREEAARCHREAVFALEMASFHRVRADKIERGEDWR